MTISIKQCIVCGRYTYNQAQTMDRNRLRFKTTMLQQNFRQVSILGQISNCLTKKPFPYINGEKASEGPLFDDTS